LAPSQSQPGSVCHSGFAEAVTRLGAGARELVGRTGSLPDGFGGFEEGCRGFEAWFSRKLPCCRKLWGCGKLLPWEISRHVCKADWLWVGLGRRAGTFGKLVVGSASVQAGRNEEEDQRASARRRRGRLERGNPAAPRRGRCRRSQDDPLVGSSEADLRHHRTIAAAPKAPPAVSPRSDHPRPWASRRTPPL